MNALTIVKQSGSGRGGKRGYTVTSVINGHRKSITVIARNGCEALALFARLAGDAAPKVAA